MGFVNRKIKKLIRGRRTYLTFAFVWAAVLIPLTVSMVYLVEHEGDSSRPYVPELRKIADETPVYPGAQKTSENVILKDRLAYFFNYFKSSARFADVESFYQRELPLRGWTPPRGPSKSFFGSGFHDDHYQRGDYFIGIQESNESGEFGITFIWDPQGPS